MATRPYKFLTGPEQSALPGAQDPVVAGDFMSYGFAELTYAHLASWGDAVASKTALRGIGTAARFNGQQRLVTNDGVGWWFNSSSSATDDDTTVLQPTVGSGRWLALSGAGMSGSPEVSSVPLGEPLLATDIPAAAYVAIKQAFVITSLNNKIDFNEGAGAKFATIATGTYRYDNSYERAKLHLAIKTALEAVAGVTGVYTITFDASTRKITIASTVSFSLLNNTGSHAAQSACVLLFGYSGAADTSSATTHAADNAIDATVSKKLFALKTDASYPERSRGIQGVIDSAGAQYATKNIKKHSTISGFTGLTEGAELFTAKGSITISALNNKIDFTEGGAELHATVASGEYVHDGTTDYGGLSSAIKTALQAVGAGTYTVTYDNDTDKFTIVKSAGTFTLKFLTGTNNAVSIDTSLGYTHTDKTGALTYTATNALALRGKLVPSSSTKINQNSVFGAFAQDTSNAHVKRSSIDKYLEVVSLPGSFLTAPEDATPSSLAFGEMAANASGQAVRCYIDVTASPEVIRFQYRPSANAPWQTSASSFAKTNSDGVGNTYDSGSINNVHLAPRIVIDDNGKCFALCAGQWSAARQDGRAWHSTDGGVTWAKVTGNQGANSDLANDGSNNYGVGGVRQRGNKVFYALANTAGTQGIYGYAEDTGSGYGTATSATTLALDGVNYGIGIEIQYFPEQVGANQYRYVMATRGVGTSTDKVLYMKGDLSGATAISLSSTSLDCIAMTREINDGGNRICGLLGGASANNLVPFYTNNDYNSGTLTVTEGTNQNGAGSNISHTNGFRSEDQKHSNWGLRHKMVMLNGRAWAVVQHNFSSIHRYTLWTTSDVTTNSWTNLGEVIGSDSTNQQGEMRILYVSAMNSLLFIWKRGTNSTTLSQNLTNGQIFARLVQLDANGATLSYGAAGQIDNGEALGTWQGGLSGFPHSTGAGVSWTKSTGTIRAQKFAA